MIRRLLVLIALFFWQGGFTFYAAVVVPVGMEVLKDSPFRQGFITRHVTYYLNITGAVALVVLGGELLFDRDPSRRRGRARLLLWGLMVLCQAGLFLLHGQLESLMESEGRLVLDSPAFYVRHRIYLWIHAAQWAAAAVFLVSSVCAWRAVDWIGERGASAPC